MSNVIIIIDTVIVALNVIFFKELEIGLYSAIAIYLMGKIIDIVFEGIDSIGTSPASTIAGLNAFDENIVLLAGGSDKGLDYKEIGEKISKGTTGLYGKGMYTNKEKLVLMCAASRGDVARVKQVAREIDSNSFIIIANAREVVGLGFKK